MDPNNGQVNKNELEVMLEQVDPTKNRSTRQDKAKAYIAQAQAQATDSDHLVSLSEFVTASTVYIQSCLKQHGLTAVRQHYEEYCCISKELQNIPHTHEPAACQSNWYPVLFLH